MMEFLRRSWARSVTGAGRVPARTVGCVERWPRGGEQVLHLLDLRLLRLFDLLGQGDGLGFFPSAISSSAIPTAPLWCSVIPSRNIREASVPWADSSSLSWLSVIMPSMPWPPMSDSVGSPHAFSHPVMVWISGPWASLMVVARSVISPSMPSLASMMSLICTACLWWGIIICANIVSASLCSAETWLPALDVAAWEEAVAEPEAAGFSLPAQPARVIAVATPMAGRKSLRFMVVRPSLSKMPAGQPATRRWPGKAKPGARWAWMVRPPVPRCGLCRVGSKKEWERAEMPAGRGVGHDATGYAAARCAVEPGRRTWPGRSARACRCQLPCPRHRRCRRNRPSAIRRQWPRCAHECWAGPKPWPVRPRWRRTGPVGNPCVPRVRPSTGACR